MAAPCFAIFNGLNIGQYNDQIKFFHITTLGWAVDGHANRIRGLPPTIRNRSGGRARFGAIVFPLDRTDSISLRVSVNEHRPSSSGEAAFL